jgi:hypothetical protein
VTRAIARLAGLLGGVLFVRVLERLVAHVPADVPGWDAGPVRDAA